MVRTQTLQLAAVAALAAALIGIPAAQAAPTFRKRTVAKVAEPKNPTMETGKEIAVIQTPLGNIEIEFYENDAPQHVANFKKLAREGFYDGTTFHRVIPNFVIQGGDPNSKDSNPNNDGQGGPGYTLPAEIKRPNVRGAVAAARLATSVNPEKRSSGSQFYIVLKDQPSLDSDGYTVFGRVIKGMDVADKIAAVQRDSRDRPVDPVVMTKVTIETR
jgi:cyclophilin family peptidyl-prolyl cis-trans isomerase